MAEVVECLPRKHKALSSNPRTTKIKERQKNSEELLEAQTHLRRPSSSLPWVGHHTQGLCRKWTFVYTHPTGSSEPSRETSAKLKKAALYTVCIKRM
jgi:hypothetical protein